MNLSWAADARHVRPPRPQLQFRIHQHEISVFTHTPDLPLTQRSSGLRPPYSGLLTGNQQPFSAKTRDRVFSHNIPLTHKSSADHPFVAPSWPSRSHSANHQNDSHKGWWDRSFVFSLSTLECSKALPPGNYTFWGNLGPVCSSVCNCFTISNALSRMFRFL
jgi:hypothetical protein